MKCGNHNNKLVAVVGTRTLAYQFYAKFDDTDYLWLGLRDNSDYDFFTNSHDFKPQRGDVFRGTLGKYCGLDVPYLIDGTLHSPQDLSYLNIAITKKLFKFYGPSSEFLHNGQNASIYDEKMSPVCTLRFFPVSLIWQLRRLTQGK